MKVVSISGSNRKYGNTETIIKEFDKQFSIAEISPYKNKYFTITKKNIHPCKSCLKCKQKGKCVISDGFKKIALKMVQSDLIILGSPVYFSHVSAQIKALIDRTYSLWHDKKLKGKNVILVATCAEYGTGHTIDTMRHWAKEHEMNIIATVEGTCDKKGRVLENEMTMKAIMDAMRSCDGIIPPSEPEPSKNYES